MSDTDSGESVNLPVSVATRLSQETADKLGDYCDRENFGKSVAVRRLIRDGLDREFPEDTGDNNTDTPDILLVLGGVFGAAAILGYFSGGGNPDTVVYALAGGLILAGAWLKWGDR